MNYEDMNLHELEAKRFELMTAVEAAQAELSACAAALDKKLRANDLERKLGGLSPEDLETLKEMLPKAQSMAASGIASEESVGTPGE